MATLVLTAVGSVVGGPVGGAIGAALGGALDRRIFKARPREGPRRTELAVQTSSYGTAIPKLFGTIRVAGTVIWATDLIEHRSVSGGDKSGAAVANYAYSASFAVLLSARAIRGIGRVWADGKLLRGAAGDLKAEGLFRWYSGSEDQPVDPLIASAEGAALTPACRGQAYAVFEGLALADFGNRIPSLTFEVVADDAPVAIGAIVGDVSGEAVGGDVGVALGGFSALGGVREVVDGLAQASGAWFAENGGRLELRAGDGAAVTATDAGAQRGVRAIAPADTAPREVTIGYYDAARDYQAGLQRVARPGAGQRTLRIDLPAVIEAGAAKALAGAALGRIDSERERRSVMLDWRAITIAPGDRVRIAGEAGRWRVSEWTIEGMVLTLELKRIASVSVPAQATSGRVLGAPDVVAGATVIHAFEMPPVDDAVLSQPRLTIAAAGTGAGWRRAALQLSQDGVSWTAIGGTRAPAVLGWVAVAPGAASSRLIDRRHAIEVTLAHDAMELHNADAGVIDGGGNLAMVGDELVQFGRAERIGPARWRLSELWRGRRGTEWAAGLAVAGDRFVMIDPGALASVDLPVSAVGGSIRVMASGLGDGVTPPIAVVALDGASIAPPSPVHVHRDGDMMRWTRRSRAGWRWIDGVDAPLGEEREAYHVTLSDGVAVVTEGAITATPDGFAAVQQIGSVALSRPNGGEIDE